MKILSRLVTGKKGVFVLTKFNDGKRLNLRKLTSYNEISEPIREKAYTWSSSTFGPANLIERKSERSYSSMPIAQTDHMHNFVVHSENIDKSVIHINGRVKNGVLTNVDAENVKLPRVSFDGIYNSAYEPKRWHEPIALKMLRQLISGYASKLK